MAKRLVLVTISSCLLVLKLPWGKLPVQLNCASWIAKNPFCERSTKNRCRWKCFTRTIEITFFSYESAFACAPNGYINAVHFQSVFGRSGRFDFNERKGASTKHQVKQAEFLFRIVFLYECHTKIMWPHQPYVAIRPIENAKFRNIWKHTATLTFLGLSLFSNSGFSNFSNGTRS